jgi:hypothetical protein
VEQKAEIRAAVVNHFSDVFDQSTGLQCMIGPEMVIQKVINGDTRRRHPILC